MRGAIHRPLHRPPPTQPAPGGPVGPAGLRGPRRGLVLVMTLWLVIVISLVAYSLAYEMQMEMEELGGPLTKQEQLDMARRALQNEGIEI